MNGSAWQISKSAVCREARRNCGIIRTMNRADTLALLAQSELQRRFGAQFYLEDLLGCPVDLVTEKALRSQLRPFVEQDAIHV